MVGHGSSVTVQHTTIMVNASTTPKPVRVSLRDLTAGSADVQRLIKDALGSEPGCLGIILISDLPAGFAALRERMFILAHRLANASDEVKATLEAPETHYFFGWSHGKERMNGVGSRAIQVCQVD